MVSDPSGGSRATVNDLLVGGEFEAAERAARTLVQCSPVDPDSWFCLARAQTANVDFGGANHSLHQADALSPGRADVLMLLGKVKAILGDRGGALKVLTRATQLHPGNVEIAIALATYQDDAEAIVGLQTFAARAADNPQAAAKALAILAQRQNREARRQAGMEPDFSVSWNDALNWSDLIGLKQYRSMLLQCLKGPKIHADTIEQLGAVAVALRDWNEAERCFGTLRQHVTQQITDVMSFDPKDWATCATQTLPDILQGLPSIERLRVNNRATPTTVLLPSDPVYCRRFILPLLQMFKPFVSRFNVHVHLLDGHRQNGRCLRGIAGMPWERT